MIKIDEESKIKCCGCGACAQVCPQQCITMKADQEGFAYPEVDAEKCIGCNLCEKVCPIISKKDSYKEDDQNIPKSIGGWHKDDEIRYESSSGGAFSLIAMHIIKQGGIVYGAAMDENLNTTHIGVDTIEELATLRGSKYVQSDINDTYTEIEKYLKQGRKVLFTGTPCQAAGLASFLRKKYENLYIMDFICHGVPSPKVFQSYIEYVQQKCNSSIISFKFRLKDKQWSPSGLQLGTGITTSTGKFIRNYPAFKDSFMNGFLDDVYLRPSCYDCEFKCLPKYYADITIADFWGVDKVDKELLDKKGTSLLLLHSSHGEELFDSVKDNFHYKECDFKASIRRNKSLIKSVSYNPRREKFFHDYQNKPFPKVMLKYMTPFSWGIHKASKIAWAMIEKIVKTVMSPILHIFNIRWTDKQWESFLQFIKFAMVGVTNTLVSYLINIMMLMTLRNFNLSFDYMIANVTAFLLSVLWSYYWNSKKVFTLSKGEKRSKGKTLLKTYVSYAFTGIVLNNVLSTIWIQVLGISKYLSPILNLPFSMPVNFLMNKLWAYSKKKSK